MPQISLRPGTAPVSIRILAFTFPLFKKKLFIPILWNKPSCFAPTDRPLQLVAHLADWLRQVLHCTVGIRDWPSFLKKFKPASSRLCTCIRLYYRARLFMLPLGSVRGDARRNMEPTPSFRRRRIATSSVPASILISVLAPSSVLFHVEDEEVSLLDADLRPRKRKAMDMGEGVPAIVDLSEGKITIRETTTMSIEEDVRAAFEVPPLEEINAVVPSHLQGKAVAEGASGDGSALSGARGLIF